MPNLITAIKYDWSEVLFNFLSTLARIDPSTIQTYYVTFETNLLYCISVLGIYFRALFTRSNKLLKEQRTLKGTLCIPLIWCTIRKAY